MRAASIRYLNPFRLVSRSTSYEILPAHERQNGSAAGNGMPPSYQQKPRFLPPPAVTSRFRVCRSPFRIAIGAIILILVLALLGGGGYQHHRKKVQAEQHHEQHPEEPPHYHYQPPPAPPGSSMGQNPNHETPTGEAESLREGPALENAQYWRSFPRLNGYYNGVRKLVNWTDWTPETTQLESSGQPRLTEKDYLSSGKEFFTPSKPALSLRPELFNPYPEYNSSSYLKDNHPVSQCYIDKDETRPAPDIFVYPGIPQHMTMPYFGSYEEIGLRHDVCFERFGRMGAYGYGYGPQEGGLGIGTRTESQGSDAIWELQSKINWNFMDWGKAQKRCHEKNKHRFAADDLEELKKRGDETNKKTVPRTAYVLRAWTGFDYTAHEIITLRSMITELALKSGGEYDVHLLLHVRDDHIPIWSSNAVYQKVIEDNIPREFWGITILWSMQLMRMYYPGPFEDNAENPSGESVHGVYRSAHFALQWFAQEHPEYDFVWNWEMDMRYSGHHYEFHSGVVEWAKKQPRRGLWERNAKFWIPAYHGNWKNFTSSVDAETIDNGQVPIWGPVSFPNKGMLESPSETKPPHGYFEDNFEWGVGEEADLITFTPIFDPSRTNWVFREDITGYSLDLPVPPRRCAIVTVARLSRRLLNLMHEETYISRRHAFPEMWPPTVALHHGLKAVYIPHAVYFDRSWPYEYMDEIFNYPRRDVDSVFGFGEHNWFGSSFYYNSGFSGALWRRWLGERENEEGGAKEEIDGSGRMCLRSTLHHPIKHEDLPTE